MRVQGLSKEFEGAVRAVDNVSFEVEQGELLVLLGPSGCGKTTTLRMIAGLEEPDVGEIWLGSALVSSTRKNVFVPSEKRNIGMVFQSYAIWPHMTVFDNVAFPLRVRRAPRKLIQERVGKTLGLVGLDGMESRSATTLSGGQQQRVALARALVFEPHILLLDEPLSNLDAKLRVHMRTELKQLQQTTGITSIFVTHDQAESMALADRIVVMNAGRIEQVGTPVDVYERPRSRFVNEFVGVINVLQGVVAGVDGSRVTLVCGDQEVHGYVAGDMQLIPGERAVATIRPEKLSLRMDDANGSINHWPARVVAASYYGDHREYELDIGNLPMKISTPSAINVEKGARVGLTCDPAEVIVIADRQA